MELPKQRLEDAFFAEEPDFEEIRRILLESPSLINERCGDGRLFLHAAAQSGNPELLSYVVEHTMSRLELRDDKNRDALHYAACSGSLECCMYLTERVGLRPDRGDAELICAVDLAHEAALRGEHGAAEIEAYFTMLLGAPLSGMYRNPIRRGMFPDPSIAVDGDTFYMVNSTFIFFPCIPISRSKDLVHWEIAGYAVTDPEVAGLEGLEGGRGYWAPDISTDGERWYVTATLRGNDGGPAPRRQMIVSAARPEGPYGKPVFIEEDGIDPSLFHEDGRHYMLLNRGARLLELNADCTEQISPARLLYYGSYLVASEGSHLLKKDGWYYLFQAEGGTGQGHRMTAARSRTLTGVYEPCPYNPILRQEDPEGALQRCGHGKPICTPAGEWYVPYLCGRKLEGYTILGRETALDPMTWTADGWPIVNSRRGPGTLQPMPRVTGEIFAEQVRAGHKFRGSDISPGYEDLLRLSLRGFLTPRPPLPGAIRLKNGHILLQSDAHPFSGTKARNILLCRQTEFRFVLRAELFGAERLEAGQEAGIAGYYDENSWVFLAVFRGADGALCLQVREHIGTEDVLHPAVRLDFCGEGPLCLGMRAEGLKRQFGVRLPDGSRKHICTLDHVTYLSDEGVRMGKRFTGAMAGIWAWSKERPFAAEFSVPEGKPLPALPGEEGLSGCAQFMEHRKLP